MITEVVLFDLPPGTTRARMVAQFQESIARWRADPALLRKHMIFDLARQGRWRLSVAQHRGGAACA